MKEECDRRPTPVQTPESRKTGRDTETTSGELHTQQEVKEGRKKIIWGIFPRRIMIMIYPNFIYT